MEPLLLLVHRIPYPPNKGDKIRSFQLLRHLAKRYRVFLGAFVDDEADWEHQEILRQWCEDLLLVGIDPPWAKLKSLRGLLNGQALSVPYYRSRELGCWVDAVVARAGIQRMVAFSSPMAQYLDKYPAAKRVIDFVDVDSDKWAQYARAQRWPLSWIYRREARRLLEFEQGIASRFDASLFVSSEEAALFRRLAPRASERVGYVSNGVDHDYFSPDRSFDTPFRDGERALVFTGAMDYWANVEAVRWFAAEVFPLLYERDPSLRFYIVGMRPTREVIALGARPGIEVTGGVPDVRPYLAHAAACVAPLRIARGIQNKVLEAMAMAKAVVVTPQALDGIDARPGENILLARDAQEYVARIDVVLTSGGLASEIGRAARDLVVGNYSWDSHLSHIDALLDTLDKAPEMIAC